MKGNNLYTWKKTGEYISLEDYFEKKSGVPISELLNPPATLPDDIENLVLAAQTIKQSVCQQSNPIVIFGDYDADGLTATAILSLLFSYFDIPYRAVIPRRMSDGYGVSLQMVEDLRNTLIVTVDNGISALDAIALAKQNGNTVIILDHHLPSEELPAADVIVDPHIHPDKNGFAYYCGAGLAYKLAEYMLNDNHSTTAKNTKRDMLALATIGTIADVVPLIGDNRYIVKEGLRLFEGKNREQLLPGVQAIANLAGENIDEETIAFRVAPLINAPGRLYDRGGESVLKLLLCQNLAQAYRYARKMEEINTERKALVELWYNKIKDKALRQAEAKKCPIVVFQRGMPAGIVGIVTGKLMDDFHAPTFVFAQEKAGDTVKGSGRADGEFDLSALLPALKDIVISAGGHKGAAGIAVSPENYVKMVNILQTLGQEQKHGDAGDLSYDMILDTQRVGEINRQLRELRPFGAGVPKPVFAVMDASLKNGVQSIQFIGSQRNHVRLALDGLVAVGFYMAARYQDEGSPFRFNLLGTLSENTYKGNTTDQFIIEDFKSIAACS